MAGTLCPGGDCCSGWFQGRLRSAFSCRGNAGPDPKPSDHLPSVAQTAGPPAHVLSEMAPLPKPQPGRSCPPPELLPSLARTATCWPVPSHAFPSPSCLFTEVWDLSLPLCPQSPDGLGDRRTPSCSPPLCSLIPVLLPDPMILHPHPPLPLCWALL